MHVDLPPGGGAFGYVSVGGCRSYAEPHPGRSPNDLHPTSLGLETRVAGERGETGINFF